MYFWDSMLSAVSLAMDAFAISICIGANANARASAGIRVALACGSFQFFMPLLGWLLGEYAIDYIAAFDHWVAFALLAFVGGNMVRSSFGPPDRCSVDPASTRALLNLAVATSIDALAIGAGFAVSGRPVAVLAVGAGLVTAALCCAGVRFGAYLGGKVGKRVECGGGIVIILIGLNILREHLFAG